MVLPHFRLSFHVEYEIAVQFGEELAKFRRDHLQLSSVVDNHILLAFAINKERGIKPGTVLEPNTAWFVKPTTRDVPKQKGFGK